MKTNQLDLLMVHADERGAGFVAGLESGHVESAPRPSRQQRLYLFDDDAEPGDLMKQRWGIIAPRGERGDRLRDLVAPLIAQRRAEQGGHEVREYRVPARMTVSEAARWKKRIFCKDDHSDSAVPRYVLILGDLHEVPLAVQLVLTTDFFVGRLAFDRDAAYRAYADKLLHWQACPTSCSRGDALLYSACDGTTATRRGHEGLIEPVGASLRKQQERGDLAIGDLRVVGDTRPDPGNLWRLTETERPGVLFTLSHGVGAPVSGWDNPERQRREQGALSFGDGGVLAGHDLEGQKFLPGGVWLLFACFGAGTPSDSAYHHWLNTLREIGHVGNDIEHVLNTLATDRPFIASVPRSALASPDGPLCVVGHIDLAWSYSFMELHDRRMNRPGRFMNVVKGFLRGSRAGVALRSMARSLEQVNTELTALYDRHASQGRAPLGSRDQAYRGHLWMLRQDLAGYVLLGDPAVRLPLAGTGSAPVAPTTRDVRQQRDQIESAVARMLADDRTGEQVANEHGLAPGELQRWFECYRDAGRAALDHALTAAAGDTLPGSVERRGEDGP